MPSSLTRNLVTGGAGFLGSHLCDRFVKDGYYVIAMDNLITGNVKNIEHLLGDSRFEFQNYDVTKFVHVSVKNAMEFIDINGVRSQKLPD